MVRHAKWCDKNYNRTSTAAYITPDFLERLRKVQKSRCTYCTIPMQSENRMLPDGLTIQRLDNSLPHSKNNCILACFKCNLQRVEKGNKEDYIRLKRAFVAWNCS